MGKRRQEIGHQQRRAVVVGASVAGVLAARVLGDFFEHVTIVERDRLPNRPDPRSGVPQGQHLHGLLARGGQVIDELLPGMTDELVAAGVPRFDLCNDLAWLTPAGWGYRFPSGITTLSISRPFLEWHLRERVLRRTGVELLAERAVVGLTNRSDGRIDGVVLRHRDSASTSTLSADLVVDAGGRSSRAPVWVSALGYPVVTETVIDPAVTYTSRFFTLGSQPRPPWVGAYSLAAIPHSCRAGGLMRVENDRYLVTLFGFGGERPGGDEHGFLEFARALRSPLIGEFVERSLPCSEISTYSATASRRRHWENLSPFPEGYLAIGDAFCAFNPVYGQGMTTACLAALTLQQWLQKGHSSGVAFQRQLAKVIAVPWLIGSIFDGRVPVEGAPPISLRDALLHRYADFLAELETTTPSARSAVYGVMNMVRSPAAILRPEFVLPFLVRMARRRPAQLVLDAGCPPGWVAIEESVRG